ncbi:MAG: peptide chain release factor N(5)-glutamine methyltransferase [Deltaproteobacteria bacterium]|nr:peptide chain release factor N(5)-glutamine methyltransferase [Deltaproteobacteria bacterium]
MSEVERTISGAFNWGSRLLKEGGIESPRVDAELLLRKALKMDRVELYLSHHRAVTQQQCAHYKSLIHKRIRGEPIQYILGRREFWSLDLKMTSKVFIPRPETELVVEEALKIFREARSPTLRFMEIGTGSGAIAIALAKEMEGCFILAEDVSWEAIVLAKENAEIHGVSGNIRFLVGDLFSALKEAKFPFDLIVSNPPYIPSSNIGTLPREIAEFEPRIALDGGPDGLQFIRKIVMGVRAFLKDGGWLILELGQRQGDAIAEMIRDAGFFESPSIAKDHSGADRVVRARKGLSGGDERGVRFG